MSVGVDDDDVAVVDGDDDDVVVVDGDDEDVAVVDGDMSFGGKRDLTFCGNLRPTVSI